jgi:hypothetical protein
LIGIQEFKNGTPVKFIYLEDHEKPVKVLRRRGYGIFNLRHLFQRIYLDLHGYRLFAATTIYV